MLTTSNDHLQAVMNTSIPVHHGSFAILTAAGRGAVATIMVDGDLTSLDQPGDACGGGFTAVNGVSISQQPLNRVAFGYWGAGNQEQEEVVCCRVAAHRCEIHCHGGILAINRIKQDFISRGFVSVPWQQLTTHGNWDREYQQALTQSLTKRTAIIILDQQTCFRQNIRQIIDPVSNASCSRDLIDVTNRLQMISKWKRFGLHLTRPWQVVLFGRPNVGKSSLINSILGYQRAIVHDQPGTTRDLVAATTAMEGWPINLIDTAGLRALAASETSDETVASDFQIESAGMNMAKQQLASADLKLLLFDSSQRVSADELDLIKEHPDALLIANKSDIAAQFPQQIGRHARPVSAKTGTGVSELCSAIVQQLIPEIPPTRTTIPFTQRQSEIFERAITELTASRHRVERIAVEVIALLEEIIS